MVLKHLFVVKLKMAWIYIFFSLMWSKQEQTDNPNAVINALKTYESSMKDNAMGHNKFMKHGESMENLAEDGEEPPKELPPKKKSQEGPQDVNKVGGYNRTTW